MIIKPLKLLLGTTILCLFSSGVFAQKPTTATHIPKSEIMAAYQGLGEFPDQQVRVVDIGDDINAAVGILRRESASTEEGEGVTVLHHHQVTEVYYVLSGSGVLVTGGDATGDRELPAECAF